MAKGSAAPEPRSQSSARRVEKASHGKGDRASGGKGGHGSSGNSEAKSKRAAKSLQSKMLINTSITTAAESGDAFALLETIELHLMDMNDINLATALHRLAKLSTRRDAKYLQLVSEAPTFEKLHSMISVRILEHGLRPCHAGAAASSHGAGAAAEMPVQCLSVIAWSYAVMKLLDRELFVAIDEVAAPRTCEFQPFELAQLVWSFAQAGFFFPDIFRNVEKRMLCRRKGEFKGLCLAMTAWSFATAGYHSIELFKSLATDIPQHATDLRPQELAQTMWAFAEAKVSASGLFQALGWSAATPLKLKAFKPQELADAVWAFAASEQQHPAFLMQAGDAVVQKQNAFSPENIATLLWSYAKLQVPDSGHVQSSLIDGLIGKLSGFQPEGLAKALSAAMQLRACTAGMLNCLAQYCPPELFRDALEKMPGQGLIDMAMICIGTDTSPLSLFNGIVEESICRAGNLDAAGLMETLYCALSASLQPRLGGNTGVAWIASTSQALIRQFGELSFVDKEKLRGVLRTFRGSPGIAAAFDLQSFLDEAAFANAAGHPRADYDSTRTTNSMISTACSSDKGSDPAKLRQNSKVMSVESEDQIWASIRQQSIKRQSHLGFAGKLSPIPSMDRAIAKVASLPLRRRQEEPMVESFPPLEQSDVPQGIIQSIFNDSSSESQESSSNDVCVPSRPRTLSDLLAERQSLGSRPMNLAEVAALGLQVLQALDVALKIHGPAAVAALSAGGLVFDDTGAVKLELPALPSTDPLSAAFDKIWFSPEERAGAFDAADPWPATSYRLGLLLRSAVITGRADDEDDFEGTPKRSASNPVVPPPGLPSVAPSAGSRGNKACEGLFHHLVRRCLRETIPEAPARLAVEASLAVVAMQAKFSV